jgi:hypothetical protein
MKRLASLIALALSVVTTIPGVAQPVQRPRPQSFASDFQTVPVMANTPGVGTTFSTYVAILNPTASAFAVQVSLYDAAGVRHDATINLAAGELKTYDNFLDAVFEISGGGAVVFQSPETAGGTHNNRFILSAEVRTAGARYGTTIPVLEFAGSSSRSFSPGISVNATSRANVGCFNQSAGPNQVMATIFDANNVKVGSVNLNLAGNAWGQTALNAIVTGGYVQFDPSDSAVCYAVVVDNTTNDGRVVSAAEYQP